MACLLVLLVVFLPDLVLTESTYRAAVYERVDPSNGSVSLKQIMLDSVKLYREQAEHAASLGVDILVFPEYGVTGLSVPNTRKGIRPYLQILPWLHPGTAEWNPCLVEEAGFNVTIVRLLSCVARANSLTLVANFGTMVLCESVNSNATCPSDGAFQFNSDVVFSNNGSVLAVYHKINLYNEPAFDFPPIPPAITTFDTDFGSFGLITCFDILWNDPTVMLAQAGIRNLLMPTAWVDGLPFLTSVQSQMAWAMGLDVNIIAANIQRPADGYRGSGIYSGQHGYLTYIYGPLTTGTLLVADLPSAPTTKNTLNLELYHEFPADVSFNYSGIIYDDLSNYTFEPLTLGNVTSATIETGSGSVRCFLHYTFDGQLDDGDYYLAAYQGDITLGGGVYVLSVEVCALMWCRNADTTSCTRPPVTSSTNLTSMLLTGYFSTSYVYPSILKHDLQLIPTSEWSFSKTELDEPIDSCNTRSDVAKSCESENVAHVSAELKTESGFLYRPIVASLYGRRYDKDSH